MAAHRSWSQRKFIFLYICIAVPLAVILLFFFNPSLPGKTRDYIHQITESPGNTPQDAETPIADVLADELAGSPQQAPAPIGDGAGKPTAPEEAVSAVPEVPSKFLDAPVTIATAAPDQNEPATELDELSEELTTAPEEPQTEPEEPQTEPEEPQTSGFNDDTWWFQNDLDPELYPLPKFDIKKLHSLAPHNYRGLHNPTYATYYASRNATLHNPFFISALQIVYRLLWDQNVKSDKHPITVFVAPYVPEEQRQYFAAAGALVREVNLIPYTPDKVTFGRWRDMYSKLEMWRQTDFSLIAYLDSDAFPVNKTDSIFDLAEEQTCKQKLLPKEDQPFTSTICKYTLSGVMQAGAALFQGMNAGVMVFSPNRAMYTRLMREIYTDDPKWDTGTMEQGYLNWMYRKDGPFPFSTIPEAWNTGYEWHAQGKEQFIVHDKAWAHVFEHDKDAWSAKDYKDTWADMLALYESEEFSRLRKEDHEQMLADLE